MASCTSRLAVVRCSSLLPALFAALFFATRPACAGTTTPPDVKFGKVNVGDGNVLHYAEEGRGEPVVFVHGSLSDFSYWKTQVDAFSKHYRAIAYSRRYNFPNSNVARPGYSAIADADDLAGFIRTMHLGHAYVIGHSYGALTGLYLAIHHPELIRALVLAEPPAIPLLNELSGGEAARGRALYADIQRRMVEPMRADFAHGRREAGVADFIDYVFADPHGWQKMPADAQRETMRDAHEWDVMMTTGTLFPPIGRAEIEGIRVPVLIMSGAKSYPFLTLIDHELARAIPGAREITYAKSGHQMWMQEPDKCRSDAQAFFAAHRR